MQINQLAGQLLLAMPSMQDPNFKDAVVLICHYDEDGCMGLIINHPRQTSVQDVLTELGITSKKSQREISIDMHQVFEGGPVDEFRGFVLHDGWHIYESTTRITSELHLTASRDVLEALALGDGPEHYLLLLGYAGWAAGQLESELANNDWLVAPASHHIVFQEPPDRRWNFGAHCMGIDRVKLSNQIGHA